MKNLKSLFLILCLVSLNSCISSEVREPAASTEAIEAILSADEINYNSSTTCTQAEADIEKWIEKAGPANSDFLAQAIVTKAADRCVTILDKAGKSNSLSTKKQGCSAIQKRSLASATDDLIYSQCVLSAGVETEKGL